MSRARKLLDEIQRMVLAYEPEDPNGQFPTTPHEELLDELDDELMSLCKRAAESQGAEGGDHAR